MDHLSRLSREVEEASAALMEAVHQRSGSWRTARDLRDEVEGGWTPSAVMIAINRLVAKGLFERDRRRRVHYMLR